MLKYKHKETTCCQAAGKQHSSSNLSTERRLGEAVSGCKGDKVSTEPGLHLQACARQPLGHEPLLARHWLERLTKTVPPEEGETSTPRRRVFETHYTLRWPQFPWDSSLIPHLRLPSPQQQHGCPHRQTQLPRTAVLSVPPEGALPEELGMRAALPFLTLSWDNVSGKQWAGLHVHQQPIF